MATFDSPAWDQPRVPPPGFTHRCTKCQRTVQTRSVGRREDGSLEHRATYKREQCRGSLEVVAFTRKAPTKAVGA
jgi:hypothetical protein